jgi:hypothetical protein
VASSAAATRAAGTGDAALELEGQSIGTIIEQWARELEGHSIQFQAHGDVLEAWDMQIHQSRCAQL